MTLCYRAVPGPPASRNNFDLIRLVAAISVFLFHIQALVPIDPLALFSTIDAGLAVAAFFVVSGYLVWMSYERASGVREFVMKRARRVVPAYVTVVIIAAFTATALVGSPLRQLWSWDGAAYFAANLSFLTWMHPSLDDVFPNGTWRQINGALWSIKVELGCYALVPVMAWMCRRAGWAPVMLATYAASVVWTMVTPEWLAHQTPGYLSFFVAGATAYRFRDWLASRWRWMGPLAIGVLIAARFSDPVLTVAGPAALALTVAYVALGLPYLGNVARFGDLSYGIYLVHWPVVQCLNQLGAFESAWRGVVISVVAVVACAWLLWHTVEKRWLLRTSHYVTSASA